MENQMSIRVSKSSIETQGREQGRESSIATGERKEPQKFTDPRSYTIAYQTILIKELFTDDVQENYCKNY
jgi:hypothetical protein